MNQSPIVQPVTRRTFISTGGAAAVAALFTVKVKEVNVLTTKAKETRGTLARSRFPGKTTPWRKAMVTLAPGEKIQFFEGV